MAVKNLILKIQDGGRQIQETMRYRDFSIFFQMVAVRYFKFQKLKFLTVLHFRDSFSIFLLNYM